MPDITEQILNEIEALPPSVNDLLEYEQQLVYDSPYIEYEWANHEIKTNLLGWVKVGLIADRVRHFRLYKEGKFTKWKDYCKTIIGKLPWQVNCLIDSAKVVLELAKAGFETLPSCESQASSLVRYFDKSQFCCDQQQLIEKWREVLSSLPSHHITKNSIDETLGHPMMAKKSRITISTHTRERLDRELGDRELPTTQDKLINELLDEKEASSDPLFGFPKKLRKQIEAISVKENLSVEEVIAKYLDLPLDESEVDEDVEALDEITEVPKHKIERWEQDLELLVEEHDNQTWLAHGVTNTPKLLLNKGLE
jgi:hypothetical protein